MRRASEFPWVNEMAQIGLRGVGSGRDVDFADARAFGSVLIGAEEVHESGVEAVLAKIPRADRYYIAFDIDALDPTLAPGVLAPSFGGLTYYQASNLLRGVARLGRVVGYNVVEIVPQVDFVNRTSKVATRLTLNLLGEMARNQLA
jgi:agmatinase